MTTASIAALGHLFERLEASTGVNRTTWTALALLVGGWAIARTARYVAERLTERIAKLLPHGEHDDEAERRRARRIVGRVVFWVVMVVFVMATTEVLGLPVVTTWLSSVASYLPRLLAAAVVVATGMVVGRLTKRGVARTAASAGMVGGQRLGRVAEIVILFGSILVAVEQLGLDLRFVTAVLTIVLATTLGGAALAFGLGSRGLVENILSGHYVKKLYDIGQVVRIDGVEGRIVKLTATSVILETDDGEVAIPARDFTVARSMRISSGS